MINARLALLLVYDLLSMGFEVIFVVRQSYMDEQKLLNLHILEVRYL
jgi:hypothetical protein